MMIWSLVQMERHWKLMRGDKFLYNFEEYNRNNIQTYFFCLQYKNQSNDSKNQIITKLQEAFLEQWALRSVRLAMKKHTTTKNKLLKGIISKNVFLYYVPTSPKDIS